MLLQWGWTSLPAASHSGAGIEAAIDRHPCQLLPEHWLLCPQHISPAGKARKASASNRQDRWRVGRMEEPGCAWHRGLAAFPGWSSGCEAVSDVAGSLSQGATHAIGRGWGGSHPLKCVNFWPLWFYIRWKMHRESQLTHCTVPIQLRCCTSQFRKDW